jgi:hypothetical protein
VSSNLVKVDKNLQFCTTFNGTQKFPVLIKMILLQKADMVGLDPILEILWIWG